MSRRYSVRGPGRAAVLLTLVAALVVGCAGSGPATKPAAQGSTPPAAPAPADTKAPAPAAQAVPPAPQQAQPSVQPMQSLVIASTDPRGSNYQQMFGIGNAIQDAHKTKVRILPLGNDLDRFLAVRTGMAQMAMTGAGHFFAVEGLEDFATVRWGPQPLQVIWQAPGEVGMSPLATQVSGIKSIAEVKGKRVAWVVGEPSLNTGMAAWLAFAGLTWDDVKKVEFSAYNPSLQGLLNGNVDVAFGYGPNGVINEIVASPKGVRWLELPADNKDAWARVVKIAPYMYPFTTDSVNGNAKGNKLQLTSYNTNNVTTYPGRLSDDEAYFLAKSMHELYPKYSAAAAELAKWKLEQSQQPDGVAPYHPGVVRYLKEIKFWTPKHDAFQQSITRRHQALQAAWESTIAEHSDKKMESKELTALWLKNRASAVAKLN